jgi:hypothetical protein
MDKNEAVAYYTSGDEAEKQDAHDEALSQVGMGFPMCLEPGVVYTVELIVEDTDMGNGRSLARATLRYGRAFILRHDGSES